MGFNTTVVVLNDRLDEIQRDPEFGKKLAESVIYAGWPEHLRTHLTGQTQVVETHHADNYAVVVVGGNLGRVAGYSTGGYQQDACEHLADVLRRNGWKVSKPKVKAT